MADDTHERFKANLALADAGVAVLVAAARVLAVIEMDGLEARKADDAVELRQHLVEVLADVVTAVPDVAGVEADAELCAEFDAVDDGAQLLERAADLRALARHRLQEDRRLLVRREDIVELLGNQRDALLSALTDVASGVEVVEVAGQVLEPLQVVGHRLVGKAAQVLLGRTGVHRVGRMRDKRADIVLVFVVQEGLDIREVELLRAAAARIAREKGKCVCIELDRLMPHGQEDSYINCSQFYSSN